MTSAEDESGGSTVGSTVGSVDAIDADLAELAGQLNVINARVVRATEAVVATGSWSEHGMRSAKAFVAWKLGLSPERAQVAIDVAERRAAFPTVMAAFERGELSFEQVAVAVTAPAWADAQVCEFAKIASVSKLRRAMRSDMFDEGPTAEIDTADAPKAPADRLSFGMAANGRWRINGELGIEEGRRVEAALTERRDALFSGGDESVTWPEAFVDCFDRSLDAVEPSSRRDHYRTWIHLDVTSGEATTTDGWRIPNSVEQRLLCDGVIQPVWEREGVPFSVGRTQRIVPERTRRIVQMRDRGCRVPGCTGDRFVEIHHIVHWLDCGPTDTWNLLSLCPRHHKLHHRGELGISGNADEFDGVVFTDSRGSPIAGSPSPTLPTSPPPVPERPYEPALRGRFDWKWIGLGWIHPNELARRRNRWRTESPHTHTV